MKNSRRHLAAYVRELHRKACARAAQLFFLIQQIKSSTREGRKKEKDIVFFYISSHMSRALRKKTPMNVAIPPVVQAIEQQETRGKTRFFSATTMSFICMTIINSAQHCKSGVIIAVI